MTAQSTIVTKMCSLLFSCSTIHKSSVLHAEECAAMSWNIVKRLANQNSVNCLFDVTGQSGRISFLPSSVDGEEKMCLGYGAKSFVLVFLFCSTSWHNQKGPSVFLSYSFY